MVVWMYGHPGLTRGQPRDHLIGVHVRAGARPGLEYIDREMRIVVTARHGLRRLRHGFGNPLLKPTEAAIGPRGSRLDQSQGTNKGPWHTQAADGKVLDRPLRLRPVERVRGY